MPVTAEAADGVLWITIDRPDDGNRWNGEVSTELREIIVGLAKNPDVQVVVVTGAGVDFCLGSFNPTIRGSMPKEGVVEFVMDANRLLDDFQRLSQITIAAINGAARGSGVEFALACDLRYAASRATIAFPEADMGGFPGAGGPVRLPLAVGDARAIELICTGKVATADELRAWGFVQDVFEDDVFITCVNQIARTISAKGPLALRGTKKIVEARTSPGFAEARRLSDEKRRALEWSFDVDEALAAHKDGRSSRFEGR